MKQRKKIEDALAMHKNQAICHKEVTDYIMVLRSELNVHYCSTIKQYLGNIICVEIYKASSQIRMQERERERESDCFLNSLALENNLQITCIMSNVATQEVISPDGIRASFSSESLHGFTPDASLEKRGSALQELS